MSLKTRIAVFAASLISLLLFQNCGRVGQGSLDAQNLSLAIQPLNLLNDFFYPYEEAPKFYKQIQIVKTAAASNFSEIAFIGVVGSADGAEHLYDYEIEVVNESNHPVCPKLTGRLSNGQTSVVGGCLSQVDAQVITIKMKVQVENETLEFSKTY